MESLSHCYPTIGSVESNRQEVQRLQKEQMEYGIYACIPGTQQTYEEAIQSLIALDLRRQYEERRQKKITSSHQSETNHQAEKECFNR